MSILSGTDQDFTDDYVKTDAGTDITVLASTITTSTMAGDIKSHVIAQKSVDHFTGWRARYRTQVTAASGAGARTLTCGMNDEDTGFELWTDGVHVDWHYNGSIYTLKIRDEDGAEEDSSISLSNSTNYYIDFSRAGKIATVKIYSNADFSTLVDTIQITSIPDDDRWRNIYALASGYTGGSSETMDVIVADMVIYTFEFDKYTHLAAAAQATVEDDFEGTWPGSWTEVTDNIVEPTPWDVDESWDSVPGLWSTSGSGTIDESPAGQLRLLPNASSNVTIQRDFGSFGQTVSLDFTVIHDSLGITTSDNTSDWVFNNGAHQPWIKIATDEISVRDDSPAFIPQTISTSIGVEYTYRVTLDSDANGGAGQLKVYRATTGVFTLLGTWDDVDIATGNDGRILLRQYRGASGSSQSHVLSTKKEGGIHIPPLVAAVSERSSDWSANGTYSAHFNQKELTFNYLTKTIPASTKRRWVMAGYVRIISVDSGGMAQLFGVFDTVNGKRLVLAIRETAGKYYWRLRTFTGSAWSETSQTTYEVSLNTDYYVQLAVESNAAATTAESFSIYVDGKLVEEFDSTADYGSFYPNRVRVGFVSGVVSGLGAEFYVDDFMYREDRFFEFSSLAILNDVDNIFADSYLTTAHSDFSAPSGTGTFVSNDGGSSFTPEEFWEDGDTGDIGRAIGAMAYSGSNLFRFGYGHQGTDPNSNGSVENDFGHTVTKRIGTKMVWQSEVKPQTAWAASTAMSVGDIRRRLGGRTITNITATNPAVVTITAHGLVTNNEAVVHDSNSGVSIDGVQVITKLTDDTFSVLVDNTVGSGGGAGTSGTADINIILEVTSISGTGTTDSIEPTWDFTKGNTTTDNVGANQVVWTARNPNDEFRFYPSRLVESSKVIGVAYWRNGGKAFAFISYALYNTTTGMFEDFDGNTIYQKINSVTKLADVGDIVISGPEDLQPSETDFFRRPSDNALVALITWGGTTGNVFASFRASYKVSTDNGDTWGSNTDLLTQWGTKRGRIRLNMVTSDIGGSTLFATGYAKYDPAESDTNLQQNWLAQIDPETMDITNELRWGWPTLVQEMGNGDSVYAGVDSVTKRFFLYVVLNNGPAAFYKILVPLTQSFAPVPVSLHSYRRRRIA